MEIKQVVRLLRQRSLSILLAVLIGTGLSGFCSYFLVQPVYEASADLILAIEVPDGETDYNTLLANGMLIRTYREILQTNRLMGRVVQANPELGVSAEELLSRVSTETTGNQILTIVVRDSSYDRARLIANALSETLVREIPGILQLNSLSVLNPAPEWPGASPVKPDPVYGAVIGFLISLLASAAGILVREHARSDIRTAAQLEQSGVPVLAVMPKVKRGGRYPAFRTEAQDQEGESLHVVMEP